MFLTFGFANRFQKHSNLGTLFAFRYGKTSEAERQTVLRDDRYSSNLDAGMYPVTVLIFSLDPGTEYEFEVAEFNDFGASPPTSVRGMTSRPSSQEEVTATLEQQVKDLTQSMERLEKKLEKKFGFFRWNEEED